MTDGNAAVTGAGRPGAAGSAPAAPPPGAVAVFGANLALAADYAARLGTDGVERGLIGPREAERIWERHLLNSAAIAPLIPADADVVDLGSGAGLPGIPLALARPDLRVRLLEPMQRRVNFLTEIVEALDLPVVVVHARAEALPPSSADVIVARAVAPLERLVQLAIPLLRPGGRLVALKGRSAEAEITAARATIQRLGASPAVVHRLDAAGMVVTAVEVRRTGGRA